MVTWPTIPADVVDWFRSVFAEVNRSTSLRLLNVPSTHEPGLDDSFIEALIPRSPPRLLPSGAVVEMNIHNIGGLRRFMRWETADIAVIVFVYKQGKLLSQKIGLLQSKRLFPKNGDVDDADPIDFAYGMNKFLRRDPGSVLGRLHRKFEFVRQCKYASLTAQSDQIDSIARFEQRFGKAIYYLLYNPPFLPVSIRYPVTMRQVVDYFPVGCRVYTTDDVNAVLSSLKKGAAPSLAQLEAKNPASNWRIEEWAADLLLTCKAGRQFGASDEALIASLLERRSGPIGAAIAVSIELGPNRD